MAERQEWIVDEEGNLTAPGEADGDGLKPPTDEFGRGDTASLERERRLQAREARRKARTGRTAKQEAAGERAVAEPATESTPPERPAPPPPKPRRSIRQRFGRRGGDPQPPKPRGAYRRRRIIALALLLVLGLLAWFLIAFFQPPPFDPGEGSGEAIVTVPEGASASQVADLLTENDVISNGTLFEWRLKLAGKTDEILPGRYVLAHDMSYGTAIDRLTSSG